MQGLIRKTEKPTKKKQRKSNKKEMARDKPANKQDHAVAGRLSRCAGISGTRSNLTTSEMVRSGHCDNTGLGFDWPPRSPKSTLLPGITSKHFSEPSPWTTCLGYTTNAQMQIPRPPEDPGLGPGICVFNKLPGESEACSSVSHTAF